jgi:phage protein D
MAVVKFRDWDIKYSDIRPGEPFKCNIRGEKSSREFVGYIHDIKPEITPGKQFVELTLIGASYRLKQARQRVFVDMTASDVAKQIAKEHNFSAFVEDHPRVYPQITQAGHTDLEILTRLAKQCGYSFKIKNTSLYFQSLTSEYTDNRASAPTFYMREANNPSGSTMYSFKLLLGESVRYIDSYKSAAQVGGVDPVSKEVNIVTNKTRPEATRVTSTVEFFDSFATDVVVPGLSPAAYVADAIDQRNRFPYRAEVEVIGNPNVAPDSPVYLSGLGKDYSGYWIVLSSQHRVVEESPNILKYTTVLQVGTDSLGTADVWKDGKLISQPEVVQIRNIVPNTTNKVVSNSSELTNGNTTYSNIGFTMSSRPSASTGAVPYTWIASATENTDPLKYVAPPTKTDATIARMAG